LEYLKKENILRKELINNLNFFEVYVPSLIERIKDKDGLINEFINEIILEKKLNLKNISKDFFSFVMNIDCFQNTYQLKKFLEWSLSVLCDNNEELITKDNIVKLMLNFVNGYHSLDNSDLLNQNIKIARETFEKKYLEYNLNKYKKNISKMSSEIGMERTALYRKLKSLSIKTE